jgi:hypothetical protein
VGCGPLPPLAPTLSNGSSGPPLATGSERCIMAAPDPRASGRQGRYSHPSGRRMRRPPKGAGAAKALS